MTSRDATQIPRAGTGNGNPAVDSDRVKAPVVGVNRLKDFGGDGARDASLSLEGVGNLAPEELTATGELEEKTSHKKQGEASTSGLQVPKIVVERGQLHRAASNTSLASSGSCVSAFSNMTAIDLESCNQDRQKIAKLRSREADYIRLISTEVELMLRTCQTQKNVSMTIKDGLKKVKELAECLEKQHKEIGEEEKDYERGLVFTEEGRQARKKIRRRIEGQLLRHAVLSSEKQKRSRSPEISPEKQYKTSKKRKEAARQNTAEGSLKNGKAPNTPKNKMPRKRVLVKVTTGQSYASVLGKIRKEVNPEASRSTVLCARPTINGDILIELSGSSNEEVFADDLRRAVEGAAEIKSGRKKVTLEICDIDPLTDKEEVMATVQRELDGAQIEVKLFEPNKRGLKLAVVILNEEAALRLLRRQHVRIGLTSCRIRRRVMVARCFRCLGFGHVQKDCMEEERPSLCYRCGESGHQIKDCKGSVKCFLCEAERKEANHVSGSGLCEVFRRALEAERKKERWKDGQRK